MGLEKHIVFKLNVKVEEIMRSEKVSEMYNKINSYYNVYGETLTDGSNQRNFGYGNQWSNSDLQNMKQNNMPPIIQNMSSKHIKAMVAEFFNNPPSVVVQAVSVDSDPDQVNKYQKLIRSFSHKSNFRNVISLAFEDALRTGCGGGIYLYSDYKGSSFQQELYAKYIDYTSLFFDPSAKEITRCDASFWGYCQNISKEEYTKRWPSKEFKPVDTSADEYSNFNVLKADDGNQTRIHHFFEKTYKESSLYLLNTGRIVDSEDSLLDGEVIIKERKSNKPSVKGYILNGSEILEECICPINVPSLIYLSGYQAVIDGRMSAFAYGYDTQGLQKLKNYALSQLANIVLNMRKETMFWDKRSVDAETLNALKNPQRMNGAFFYNGKECNKPDIHPAQPFPAALMQAYSGLTNEIEDTLGRYQAQQGAPSNEISGIAQQLRINQNNINQFFYVKNAIEATRQICEVLTQWIPLIYVEERVIPISEDEHLSINSDDKSKDSLDVSAFENMDFNVSVKTGSSFEVQKQTYMQNMTKLIMKLPQDLQPIILPDLLNLYDLPNISEINEKIENYIAVKDPQMSAAMKGEEIPKNQPNPEAMAMQQKMSNEQAELSLRGKRLELDNRRQSLDEIDSLAKYKIETEKMDNQHHESRVKTATDIHKNNTEIKKALIDLVNKMQ